MKTLIAMLLAGGAVIGSASANETMTQSDCRNTFDAIVGLNEGGDVTTDGPVTVVDGRCHVEGIVVRARGASTYTPLLRADAITWTGRDLGALGEGRPPLAVDLTVVGAYPDPSAALDGKSDMEWFRWTLRVGAEAGKRDLHLAYEWDPQTRKLVISDFSVDSLGDNDTRMTASFSNVDPTRRLKTIEEVSKVRVNEITFESGFHGQFEQVFVQTFGSLLGNAVAAEPDTVMDRVRKIGTVWIAASPDAFLPKASGEALNAFIETLPHPRGFLRLALFGPDGGLDGTRLLEGAARGEIHTAEDVAAALPGTRITAEWQPDTSGRR
ncbi:hypothetical protein C8N35_110104 [Breoghania corrubedonensis]|uniref:Uncharacterized protein n=1 Tax=Breoghania corrubedonensis TaxID=665038 RepID=A0A2T5V1J1_9HYPH|nr:hypothetical protein [Breoghania corrubedonensis]PTW57625.1 hypothetical protein C8N35_110104 [Breoghania corrubedonensis]